VFVVQVVHVWDGLSEIFNKFCYLTMSSLLYEFKQSKSPDYHQFTVTGVTNYTKLLTEEIGVRYAGIKSVYLNTSARCFVS